MPDGNATSPQPTPIRRHDFSRPNPTQSIEIELEPGRMRRLRLDFECLHNIHQATGLILWDGDDWDKIRQDPQTVAIVLREALAHEDADLTVEQVRRMSYCTIANLPYITNRLWAAYGVTLPDPDEVTDSEGAPKGGDADPNPASGSDSMTSGPTPLLSLADPMASSGA